MQLVVSCTAECVTLCSHAYRCKVHDVTFVWGQTVIYAFCTWMRNRFQRKNFMNKSQWFITVIVPSVWGQYLLLQLCCSSLVFRKTCWFLTLMSSASDFCGQMFSSYLWKLSNMSKQTVHFGNTCRTKVVRNSRTLLGLILCHLVTAFRAFSRIWLWSTTLLLSHR